MLAVGTVVESLAGRDKSRLLAVVGGEGESVLVCDGKERPVERPKLKNARHLRQTGAAIAPEELKSNRALRRALRQVDAEISEIIQEG